MPSLFFALVLLVFNFELSQSIRIPFHSFGYPSNFHTLTKLARRDVHQPKKTVKASAQRALRQSNCQPRTENFFTKSNLLPSTWVSLSTNPKSYNMKPGGGVNLVLNPPSGAVSLTDGGKTNDKLGDGATLNSTFSFLYGKISMTVAATQVPGSVTALVLFGTTTADEIDTEILGGDPTHWQTNVFRPAPGETEPLYGIFGGVHSYANGGTTGGLHTYVIDWSPERIIWSVDGTPVRTLTPDQTLHNGQRHYPSAQSRVQVGVWDASSPVGTSDWANGPIPWSKRQKQPITAFIKSMKLECPY